ncbi:SDR family oxidoreductase [Plantactinospora sp. B5E13]|uniref:SDR family oxidoreductase n=1 Tax=unclassified Plantactinospora TaxID=2631981 RepID=UPI00325D9C2A
MGVLDGKGAIVTGGSRGIGRAVVARLVADGATVVFSYRENETAAREVAERSAGRAIPVRADVGLDADVDALFVTAEDHLDGLDILVNNAAVVRTAMIADVSDQEYDRTMAVNVRGVFRALRHATGRMRDGGRIVNISTANTVLAFPGISLYAASKAAVEQFTRVAAKELGPRGITVNTVSPGATDTDMLRGANSAEVLELMRSWSPLGRLGEPADVADVVAFLVGPDGRWMTGQNLRATGGLA